MSIPESESELNPQPLPPRGERLLSIDALRGFDMFWIIGGDGLARAIGKWFGTERASTIAMQFHEHVDWEGFRFYDLIFPLFLFLVGTVLPFSLRKYQTGEHPKQHALARLARRVAMLYLLGLIYSGLLQFNFPMRMTGVLPRIAICYGIAGVIYLFTSSRGQFLAFVAILLGYWAILMYVPAPETGKAPDFNKETNLAGYIDRHYLPGRIFRAYYGYGDNEGLLSTIPAVGTTLLGVLAGQWLLTGGSPWLKAIGLLGAGVACLGAGMAWGGQFEGVNVPGGVFPIIKIMWTSSYVLVAGGWSLILLGLFYTIIDVLKLRSWAFFFVVIGVNAITIYMASRIIPFDELSKFFLGGTARLSGSLGPVILAVGELALEWLLLLYLYRNKLFLRV